MPVQSCFEVELMSANLTAEVLLVLVHQFDVGFQVSILNDF